MYVAYVVGFETYSLENRFAKLCESLVPEIFIRTELLFYIILLCELLHSGSLLVRPLAIANI